MTLVDQCAGWFSSSGWRLRPLECAHGWTPCGVVQKDRAVVRQASPIGDSSWHERSNCSLKSRNRRKRILFEVPTSQKSVVLENLDAAIAKVSDNGKFRFNPRQLLY